MDEDKRSSSNNVIAIIALIIAIIVGVALIILYFIYFFRQDSSSNNPTRWTTVAVAGDQGDSTTATITPNINYVYTLASGINLVVLLTPTVPNYQGTTFIIRVAEVTGDGVDITPPEGVTIQLASALRSGQSVTFLWSGNGTVLTAL